MFVTTLYIRNNLSMFSLTLSLLLLCTTCRCLPQSQVSGRNNNNNLRGQEVRQNNNRNPIASDRPSNTGQRILEGGFVPSNFGGEPRNVRFPDNVDRPVGRGQPQRSPFRNSGTTTETPFQNVRRPSEQTNVQNGRRPNVQNNVQNGRRPNAQNNVQDGRRPNVQNNVQNGRRPSQTRPITQTPQRSPRLLLPAIPIGSKFTRPIFDVRGNPLIFKAAAPEQGDLLPDFRNPTGSRNRGQNTRTTNRPGIRRPKGSNLGPDLRTKLPIFGRPELILKATEELRNSDVNQNAILPSGAINAGVLPLATENKEDQRLGFFPPFNVRKIQPK